MSVTTRSDDILERAKDHMDKAYGELLALLDEQARMSRYDRYETQYLDKLHKVTSELHALREQL